MILLKWGFTLRNSVAPPILCNRAPALSPSLFLSLPPSLVLILMTQLCEAAAVPLHSLPFCSLRSYTHSQTNGILDITHT